MTTWILVGTNIGFWRVFYLNTAGLGGISLGFKEHSISL